MFHDIVAILQLVLYTICIKSTPNKTICYFNTIIELYFFKFLPSGCHCRCSTTALPLRQPYTKCMSAYFKLYTMCNYVIFKKNQNQLITQYSFSFAVRCPGCLGQIYWPSSGSHIQRI